LYVRLFVAESDVEDILLLNTVQSDDESRPRDSEDDVGMFSVCVDPVDVNPNPPFVDDVANVCDAVVRPLSDVIADVRYVEVSIESVPSLPDVLTKPFEVRLESFVMFCVVFTLNDVPLYVSPVPAVVVDVHVGTPETRARICPFVPCDVVEIAPLPLPRSRVFACKLDHPVPPFETDRSVPDHTELSTVFAVASVPRPRFVLAPLAVVAPVPPYNTPIDDVALTTPLFACSGPFRVESVNPVSVPTDVSDEDTTFEARVVPVSVPAAAVTVISALPLNDTPLIFLAV